MALNDITRHAVLEAVQECNRLGRDAFLREYKFRSARAYWLVYNGQRYDSKAIAGVAHKYARPELGVLEKFSGGARTVKPTLEKLGFTIWIGNAELGEIVLPGEIETASFDPLDVKDARKKISRMIAQRQGQLAFRNALLTAYGEKCAITGCPVLDVLEAAHIYPYRGSETNDVANGLLLRADVHILFDRGLIAIDVEEMTVLVAPSLQDSEYWTIHGQKLRLPQSAGQKPSLEALKMHRRDSFHSFSS